MLARGVRRSPPHPAFGHPGGLRVMGGGGGVKTGKAMIFSRHAPPAAHSESPSSRWGEGVFL
jgi:hypothetical protein